MSKAEGSSTVIKLAWQPWIRSSRSYNSKEKENYLSRHLISGAAGFIGSHSCDRLLNDGHEVVGLDNAGDRINREAQYAGGRAKARREVSFDLHLGMLPGIRWSIRREKPIGATSTR
jgi:hypothetical protein